MSFITSPGVIFPPLTAGGVAYGTGSQAKVNTAGILGQYLISGGAGVPTFTNLGTFTTINCTNLVSSGTLASSFTVTSGTAVPLRITNVGTGNSFVVEDSANPDSSPFVIDAAGNVIVGTTASIASGVVATAPVFQEHGLTNNLSSIGLTNWSSTAGRTPSVNFNRSLGNAIGTRAGITVAGTAIGTLSFSGDDGTNWLEAARIEGLLDATGGVNDMPGRLVFSTTADGASSSTERMRIDSAGLSTFTGTTKVTTGAAVGGATPGAGGLAFPATAVAVADANTLDDYEEGNWTPVVTFTGGNGDLTTSEALGVYTKIGRLVQISFNVEFTETTALTNLTITGVPFTAGGTARTFVGCWVDNMTALVGSPVAGLGVSTTTISMQTTGTGAAALITNLNTATSSRVRGSLSYSI